MIALDTYNKTATRINGLEMPKLLAAAFKVLIKDKRIAKNSSYRVEVSFVGTRAITQLSTHYYNEPRNTDVISLSYFEPLLKKGPKNAAKRVMMGDALAGEIFISVPYARAQAKKIGQSLTEELKFLFVHGLLHVFGYDHMKPKEEAHMLALTYKILGRRI